MDVKARHAIPTALLATSLAFAACPYITGCSQPASSTTNSKAATSDSTPTADASDNDVKQKECISAISKGLQKHWEKTEVDDFGSLSGLTSAVKAGYQAELDEISNYSADDFADKEFGKLFGKYKTSLENAVKGADAFFPANPDVYNKTFLDEGTLTRAVCLEKFQRKYGLTVPSEDSELLEDAIDVSGVSHMISPKKMVKVQMSGTEVEVGVEGFQSSASYNQQEASSGNKPEGKTYAMLLLDFRNVSAPTDSNGMLDVTPYFEVDDWNALGLATENESYGFPGYDAIAGGYGTCPAGKSTRFALPYVVDEKTDGVIVFLGSKYMTTLEMEQVQ